MTLKLIANRTNGEYFIRKQILPFKEQYMAMIINPIQMNMKIWWNDLSRAY